MRRAYLLFARGHRRRHGRFASWRLVAYAAAAGIFLLGDSVLGQEIDYLEDPSGFPFRTPLASPLEPLTRLTIANVWRDTVSRSVALPDFGDRISFWIHRPAESTTEDTEGVQTDDEWELAGAIVGGAFSRFELETANKHFIEIHYHVGFQFRGRYRDIAFRTELYHLSSHLGDEYMVVTGREPVSTSREGVELLFEFAPLRGLFVYGGPGWLIGSTRGYDPPSLRGGLEWEFTRTAARDVAPFFAADLFAWGELDWDPMVSLEGGVNIGRHVRLAITYGFGPSRAEQLLYESERLLGIVFAYRR